jgi:hypothetical protein
MSKSRDNKHRRQRASRKLLEWRRQNQPAHAIKVPIEIVALEGTLPQLQGKGAGKGAAQRREG